MYNLKSKIALIVFSLFFLLEANAQCAMCRAVLESEEGHSTAKGVNNGIVYLMSFPYILIGGLGFMIYWKYFRTKKTE